MSNNTDSLLAALCDDSCGLRAPLRHFAMVLAQLANWRTGRGIAGQGRLARAIGCNARTVRKLKAELSTTEQSPVVVTWAHRSRPDGLNGSDAYSITLSPLGLTFRDTGTRGRDTGPAGRGHRPDGPTTITGGSPQGTHTVSTLEKKESSTPGEAGPSAPPQLSDLVPNGLHVKAATAAGYDMAAELGAWRAHHGKKGTTFAEHAHMARSFGGWLKFVAPMRQLRPVAPVLTAEQIEAAEVAAWKAEVRADNERQRIASEYDGG